MKKQKIKWLLILLTIFLIPNVVFADEIKNGWVYDANGNTYYYENNIFVTGTKTIDGKEYYFDNNGILHNNTVFLGDSLTDYYDLSSYYNDSLVVNSGISGNTTDDILNNIYDRVYKYNPSKVILLIGTNDIIYGKNIDYIVNNINKIVDLINKNLPKCKIYIESLYPINNTDNATINHNMVKNRTNELINNINSRINSISNTTYINVHDSLIDNDGNLNLKYTVDGLHLNNSGYEIVTSIISQYLNNPDGSSNKKNGWYYENGNTYYYIDDQVQTGIVDINGYNYYFSDDGIKQTGFQSIGENTYYFSIIDGRMITGPTLIGEHKYALSETGELLYGKNKINENTYYSNKQGIIETGWKQIDAVLYYFNVDGELEYYITKNDNDTYCFDKYQNKKSGFLKVQDDTYYFDENGKMSYGFLDINKHRYYFDNKGKMAIGWKQIDSSIYYFNNEGIMQTSIIESERKKYYLNESGIKETGFKNVNGDTYYFSIIDGHMLTGLQYIGTNTYYFNIKDGKLLTGFQNIGENTYYFSIKDGRMLKGFQYIGTNTYYFSINDGRQLFGFQYIGTNTYYFSISDGRQLFGFQYIGTNTYYFSVKDGKMLKNIQKIGNTRYEFSNDGILQHSNIKIIIDVSSHQENINWDELWNSGEIDGVILRISEGCENEDSMLSTNIDNLKRLGIPYGIYIYSYAENFNEGVIYANYTKNIIEKYKMNISLGIYLDLESNKVTSYINTQQYEQVVSGYMSVIPTAKIYTYTNYANDVLNSSYLQQYITWIANYSATDCPGNYQGWQFTSKAKLPGIKGVVDKSIFYY